MTRYRVYHATDLMQMFFHDETQWQSHRETRYQRVAEVEATKEDHPLDQVFVLTNHDDECAWMEHLEVIWYDATRLLRSTSVGDVVTNPVTHDAWMALPFGWRKVGKEP